MNSKSLAIAAAVSFDFSLSREMRYCSSESVASLNVPFFFRARPECFLRGRPRLRACPERFLCGRHRLILLDCDAPAADDDEDEDEDDILLDCDAPAAADDAMKMTQIAWGRGHEGCDRCGLWCLLHIRTFRPNADISSRGEYVQNIYVYKIGVVLCSS